jgi:gas vesicle protein
MTNKKSLLLGVLLGGLVGSISTLFTTSMSGKELRKKLQTNKSILIEHSSEIKTNGANLINQIRESTKHSAQELGLLSKELKTTLIKWDESTKTTRKSIQKELSDIEDSLENLEKTFNRNQL